MKSLTDILSNADFDNLLTEHIDFVRNFLKEVRTESYMPEILVFEANGDVQILKLFLDENKYDIVRQAGAICYQRKIMPVAAIMVIEAWMKEMSPDNPLIRSRPISSYADKQEIISIVGMTFDGRSNGAMLWFDRREDDSIALRKDKFVIIPCDKKEGSEIRGDLLPQFFLGYADEFLAKRN